MESDIGVMRDNGCDATLALTPSTLWRFTHCEQEASDQLITCTVSPDSQEFDCELLSSIVPASGGKCFQTALGFLLCSRLPFWLWPNQEAADCSGPRRRNSTEDDETDETSFICTANTFCWLQIKKMGFKKSKEVEKNVLYGAMLAVQG